MWALKSGLGKILQKLRKALQCSIASLGFFNYQSIYASTLTSTEMLVEEARELEPFENLIVPYEIDASIDGGFTTLAPSPTIDIVSKLNQLSDKERKGLGAFFCALIEHDCLGHVLFFKTKPACFSAILKDQKSQNILLNGWQSWKDYEHLFPHPNFILIEEEFPIGNEIALHIFIFNKKTLLSSLYSNITFFQEILGADFIPENFILSLEKAKTFRPLIKNDDALLGLILGYGPESSLEFKKKHQCINKTENRVAPKYGKNYKRVAAMRSKKCRIFPIEFVGNPESKEVVSVLNHYGEELEEIFRIFNASKDPLELILENLCKEY